MFAFADRSFRAQLLTSSFLVACLTACGAPEDYYLDSTQTDESESSVVTRMSTTSQPNAALSTDRIGALDPRIAAALGAYANDDRTELIDHIRIQIEPTIRKFDDGLMAPTTTFLDTDPDIYERLEIDDPTDPKAFKNISALDATEFASTCIALEKLYDSTDDEESVLGDCKYELVVNGNLLNENNSATCSQKIDICADDQETKHLPITLCDDNDEAPTNCAISQAQIASCLTQHIDSRIDLAHSEICDDGQEGLEAVQNFRDAQKCIEALAERCPSLLND